MTDNDGVEAVAREYVQRHGSYSVAILIERADLFDELGDEDSASTWRDIAEVPRLPSGFCETWARC